MAMNGAIAAVVAMITDGAEVIAVITMVGRAVAIAAGAKNPQREAAAVGGFIVYDQGRFQIRSCVTASYRQLPTCR
jgi:hypothetical protein